MYLFKKVPFANEAQDGFHYMFLSGLVWFTTLRQNGVASFTISSPFAKVAVLISLHEAAPMPMISFFTLH